MDVLALRVGQTANIITDRYGSDRVADLLATLRAQNPGAGISAHYLSRAGVEAGVDLDGLLGDWLNATDMPAFRASPVEAFRIGDDDDGTPRYQALVNVRNDRPVPGLVRFTAVSRSSASDNRVWSSSDPFPVPGESAIEASPATSLVVAGRPDRCFPWRTHLPCGASSSRAMLVTRMTTYRRLTLGIRCAICFIVQ